MDKISSYRARVDRLLDRQRLALAQVRRERQELRDARVQLERAEQAQTILQQIAQTVQEQAHQQIAGVVSKCLAAVFADQAYEFRIRFEKRRNQTEARLLFLRDGQVLEDPTEEAGGGVIDVAAFALRLACLVLSRPPARRLLVLDEPFRFVSEEYRPSVRAMLEIIAEEMDVQLIIITHDREFQIGKVIRLEKEP